MKKGFLYVIEILMVMMTTFLVMLQLSFVPKQQAEWGNTELYTKANEILSVLDKTGTDWTNPSDVGSSIKMLSSNNTVFDLKIKNMIKPEINVSCICNDTELNEVSSALTPFEINGHGVKFNVTQISPSSISFPHDQDAVVVFDYILMQNYIQIQHFLQAGKGVVEFRNLEQSDIDSVQNDFFGIVWNTSTKLNDFSHVEFRSEDRSDPYYNIYKYFHNVPAFQDDFSDDDNGWNHPSSSWTAGNGVYQGLNDTGPGNESISIYSSQFSDSYSMRASFMIDGSGTLSRNAKLILYWQDASNYAYAEFYASIPINNVRIYQVMDGSLYAMGFYSSPLNTGQWYDVKIIPQEDKKLKIYINGIDLFESQPVTIPMNSQIGLGVEYSNASFANVKVGYPEKHSFSKDLIQGDNVDNVWPESNRREKIILLQKNTDLPACIVNSHAVDDKGRTAWLAHSDPSANQDVGSMLKTLVIWAAGEEYEVVKSNAKNLPISASFYKVYDQDMFQPVEIELSMGYLY